MCKGDGVKTFLSHASSARSVQKLDSAHWHRDVPGDCHISHTDDNFASKTLYTVSRKTNTTGTDTGSPGTDTGSCVLLATPDSTVVGL